MENSGKLFFEDETPKWYLATGQKWIGPLTSADIYEKIQSNEITWAHYLWKSGQSDWKRICDIKSFQAILPHEPPKLIKEEVKEAVKPPVKQAAVRKSAQLKPPPAPEKSVEDKRIWFLYYNHSQFGPFSLEEVKRFLKIGKIHLRVYGWKEGMSNWERLGKIEAFQEKGAKNHRSDSQEPELPKKAEVQSPPDHRVHPRRPLVAKILISDDQNVIVGICRDISIGGLQVLTEKIPGKVGSKLKMNISPSSNGSGNRIDPFVAQGVIVRILEDGRGFSFRFEPLSEESRRAIESYIESPV